MFLSRYIMLLPTLLCLLIGSLSADPLDDLRSNFEFLDYSTNLDEPRYRLRDSVFPHDVNVDLDVYLEEARFNGLVTMGVEVSHMYLYSGKVN